MTRITVTCGFTEMELRRIDELVKEGYFCSRSDAIRLCTNESIGRRRSNE